MLINFDFASIVLMESFGVVSFIMGLLFFRQRQRVRNKQRAFVDAFNRRLISDKGNGKCFSSEWVMDNIVYPPKKVLKSTPLLLTFLTFLVAVFYYIIGPQILVGIVGLGYTSVIALLSIAVLLWTDAFEAYSYAGAINGVSVSELDKEDESYMELARSGLERAFMRFVSLGVAFALLGPFIPQIFNGVVYLLMMYTTVFFKASEVLFGVSLILGILIVLVLPGIMFFLPELLSRIIIRKVKPIVKKTVIRRKN